MKLYYAPGACSLCPHIVLREAGERFELARVDTREKKLAGSGADYWQITPKGQVPVLELDNGDRLTENAAIVQYIADKNPESGLAPQAGTRERYRVQEWLSHTGSELHKTFSPLFRPTTPDEFKKLSREALGNRFKYLDRHLAERDYLMGDDFTVADAYMFAVLRWCPRVEIELGAWPNLKAYVERVAARPNVKEAMQAEGLIQ
jgi:glutathione S-transferase